MLCFETEGVTHTHVHSPQRCKAPGFFVLESSAAKLGCTKPPRPKAFYLTRRTETTPPAEPPQLERTSHGAKSKCASTDYVNRKSSSHILFFLYLIAPLTLGGSVVF